MSNLSKCPVHSACLDAAMYLLTRDGRTSLAQIMRRAKMAHMKQSISWDWLHKQLEKVFGPLTSVSANLFALDPSGKDANGFCPDIQPEKFLARSNTPTAGWVVYNDPIVSALGRVVERNSSARIKGQIKRHNEVNVRLAKPTLRLITDQTAA